MEMTKQRKMLIGVLCIGLSGLVVDRMLLSSPDSAVADDDVVVELVPEPSAPAVTTAVSPAAPDEARSLPSYATLTERLLLAQQNAPQTDVSGREDPFAVPAQWQASQPRRDVNKQDQPGLAEHRITRVFKLDGTVRSNHEGQEELLAVVSGGGLDGVAIRVKQRVRIPSNNGDADEYELIEVGSRYVVWLSLKTQERITMRVEQDY